MRPGLDLRLVPVALAVWTGALLVLVLRPEPRHALMTVALLVVGCLAAAGLAAPTPSPDGAVSGRRGGAALATAAVVLGVVAGGAAALHAVQARDSTVLTGLAQQGAVATVHGVVHGDVHRIRDPALPGRDASAARHRVELVVQEVDARGQASSVRAGLAVIGDATLAPLREGMAVVLVGRLAPADPLRPVAAELRGARMTSLLSPPRGLHRVTGAVRVGLHEATTGLEPDLGGLVQGAAVGDTRRMSDDLVDAMRTVGLTHITAVSGAHVAVLHLAVAAVAAASGLRSRPRLALTAAVLAAFVVLVRPEPSVVRAAGMGAVVLVAGWWGRRAQATPALAASAGVLLVVDPWLSVSLGFALSVVATGSIVLLAPRLATLAPARLPRPVAQALAVPVAAQAACGPLVLLVQPAVSLWAVPANVLAAPALPPATLLGCATALLGPWWPEGARVAAALAAWPAWWVATLARFFAGLPGAAVPWSPGAAGVAALLVATAAAVGASLLWPRGPWRGRGQRRPERRAGAALLLVVALAVPDVRVAATSLLPVRAVGEDWLVVACDVGQGDALAVRSGPRAAVLVDVGPADGDAAACLRRLGVEQVDLLVVSHHHADHVGGLDAVLAHTPVHRALLPPAREPEAAYSRVVGALRRTGVVTSEVSAGDAGRVGEVDWWVVWPPPERAPDGADTVNDGSVTLLLQVGDVLVLAAGDLGAEAQEALTSRLFPQGAPRPGTRVPRPDGDVGVDVLKMAHHGSADQSARFAAAIAPRLVLVSAGEGNSYGHPTQSALDLYGDQGAVVRSTHTCGDLVVVREAGGPVRMDGSCG